MRGTGSPAGDRDERGRFLPGHAPLAGAGRPLGSVGFGKFRPLLDMMKQATKSEALIGAAEAEPSVATLLRRRRATAERVRRERERNGMRIVRVRLNDRDIVALVERGFLPERKCTEAELERAVIAMLEVMQAAKLTM